MKVFVHSCSISRSSLHLQVAIYIYIYIAWHATRNVTYKKAVDKLAQFFVRIQSSVMKTSKETPKQWNRDSLEGGFFRAFDFEKWEVYASDADIGWYICTSKYIGYY